MLRIEKAPHLTGWKEHFLSINLDWLARYFTVTAADLSQLQNPERIIERGGRILFVLEDEAIAGTLALIPDESGGVELAKMGVLPVFQRKGAGHLLMTAAIEEAVRMEAAPLYLETVEILAPAIRLYESCGFVRTGEPHVHPKFGRTTFRMEKSLSQSLEEES